VKVLFITPGCFDKGGISRYSQYQIQALMELVGKSQVKVLSLFGPGNDDLQPSFEVHWHGKSNDILSKVGLLMQCLWLCLSWRPRLIFIAHVNFSGMVYLLSRISNAITILNIYGLEIWGKLSWDAMMGLRNIHHIISDCHFTADYVRQMKTPVRSPITVIWDCVDLEKFNTRPNDWKHLEEKYKLPSRDHHFILLSLGRLSIDAAYKGYERLLNVFADLHPDFPDLKLIFAGKGNLIPVLREKAIQWQVQDHVYFPGSIDEDDLPGLYSYAHLFSLISHRDEQSGEGIPLTPLEAMACHVPILVGNQDGSQEAVILSKNGFVLDPFALDDHAERIKSLIKDLALREQLSNGARIVAEEHFSFPIFKEKHRRLIEEIAQGT
jgi:phosphatidylinositol alpha-1,6-mannosyltransferase